MPSSAKEEEEQEGSQNKRPRSEDDDKEDDAADTSKSRRRLEDTSEQPESGTKEDPAPTVSSTPKTKKPKDPWYHAQVPATQHYHTSWMHAGHQITAVAHTTVYGLVWTAGTDGIVKAWKRQAITKDNDLTEEPLEFAKAWTAHTDAVVALCVSPKDNEWTASVDCTGHVQFYQTSVLDAVSRVQLPTHHQDIQPTTAAWILTGNQEALLVIATSNGGPLYVASPTQSTVVQELWHLHGTRDHPLPVTALVYNSRHACILSGDDQGMLQLWDTHGEEELLVPASADFLQGDEDNDEHAAAADSSTTAWRIGGTVTKQRNGVQFSSRLGETDLLSLHHKKTHALSMAVTPDGAHYAVYGADHRIRVFIHATGKLLCTYDERLKVYAKTFDKKPYFLDALEFGRRQALASQMDIEAKGSSIHNQRTAASLGITHQLQFEGTDGQYLLMPTMMGMKIIDWQRHKLVALAGSADAAQYRFVGVVQCPGPAVVDAQLQLARGTKQSASAVSSDEPMEDKAKKITDALLIAWAYQSRRFFVFSHIDPVIAAGSDGNKAASNIRDDILMRRDHWNEAPDAAEAAAAVGSGTGVGGISALSSTQAVLHTTLGDITVQLFGQQTPKTVENFATHARQGYYDNLLFHRVIKGFMLQTGDPNGDGTGGESIWGGEFEDEIVPGLRHDRPFTLSMANAGPGTNGSQFFITTVPCPWLDGKHTVFGRVLKGMDVCTLIENVKTNDNDKPFKPVQIINIDVS